MKKLVSKVATKIESYIIDAINLQKKFPIQLDITNACNLACTHCYHTNHLNNGALNLEQWVQIIDQAYSFTKKYGYVPHFIICGGEPFVSPNLIPILNYIYSQNKIVLVTILTNATLIKTKTIELLKPYKNLSLQVSIDGPSASIHDFYRGKGKFENAISGITLLKKSGFNVSLSSVLTRKNAEFIDQFFGLAKELHVDEMNFTRFITEGYGKNLYIEDKDRPLNPLELKSAYESIIKFSAQYLVKSRIQGPLFNLIKKELGYNSRYWESAIIDYQGNLVASSRSRIILGNVLHEGLEELVLNNPFYKSLRKKEIKSCGSCDQYDVCGGDRNAAYAASGDFLAADPGCWKNIK